MPAFDHTKDDKVTLAGLRRDAIRRDRLRISLGHMRLPGIILAILAIAAMPPFVAAQTLTECEMGKLVDDRGTPATIVGDHDGLCLLKYQDGRTQRWVAAKDLTAGTPKAPANQVASPQPPVSTQPGTMTEGVSILRPTSTNHLVYRADALGNIVITAQVNGAPVRFLVDTGATLVSLSSQDASAAGLKSSELTFDQTVQTGNGPAHAAFAELHEIRIEQLEIDHVPAAVIDTLKQSVLGMSFLSRLKGFEVHDGVLTMNW